MTIRASRLCVAAALAAAAAAVPVMVAFSSPGEQHMADGRCLAWIGNKDDGNCVGRSNGQPINAGTPWGIWGPSGGGINTGPLLPGQTWNQPLN
ncbi:hypothetical protein [Mycobacterium sp. OTB74]|uniref:DUF7155 family protein n=1 Tax=Mycobacterium sp. OTB74 TaxID=1853452 RepID=UPI0024755DCF|nr:hypothetical protein [Mycobacterium sp. OTB74]MDH6245816.1 hypothetical protein [Mycobacterium sp. OTB74]